MLIILFILNRSKNSPSGHNMTRYYETIQQSKKVLIRALYLIIQSISKTKGDIMSTTKTSTIVGTGSALATAGVAGTTASSVIGASAAGIMSATAGTTGAALASTAGAAGLAGGAATASGMAAVGSVVGGGMAAGAIITAAAPIAAIGIIGYGISSLFD